MTHEKTLLPDPPFKVVIKCLTWKKIDCKSKSWQKLTHFEADSFMLVLCSICAIFFSKCGILVQHSSLLYSSVDVSIWNTLSLVRIIQQVYILKVGSHHHACKSQPAKPWTGNFQKFVTVFLPVAVYVWLFHASNFLVVSLRKSAL